MAESSTTRFVVGLGNPGRKYARTRHNIGFDVVDELAWRWHATGPKAVFEGELLEARPRQPQPKRVYLLKPQTYMNCSGRAVRRMSDFYKADLQDLLIVLDDMALSLGQLRLRPEGSAGGHNGLDDILRAMGCRDVPRLRIGIGQPPPQMEGRDYVLTGFSRQERTVVRAADAVEAWVFGGLQEAMQKYNRKVEQ
jgi:PTH1 family peptidyl-tRNA hydrolase